MSATVSTCNMAEALYLFERGNRVVKLGMVASWPYGLEELAVYFEGKTAEADHERYIRGALPVDLSGLPLLFAALKAAVPAKGELA
jgi:hypothetical protein